MAIAEDASTPAVIDVTNVRGANAFATTPSFSPPANSFLVALISEDFSSSGTASFTMSSGISGNPAWTAGPSSGNSSGYWSFIFTLAVGSTAPGSITVTATDTSTGTQGIQLAVRVLTGVGTSQSGAASVGSITGSGTSLSSSITTTMAGSWVYVVGGTDASNTTWTPNGSTTTIASYNDTSENAGYICGRQSAATGTPGATTLGWTIASNTWDWAALEILPPAISSKSGSDTCSGADTHAPLVGVGPPGWARAWQS